MAEVKVDIGNIRQHLPAVRKMAEGRALATVSRPGVRRDINMKLYEAIQDTLPVQTGALQDSPINATPQIRWQEDSNGLPHKPYRYANGDITDDGIIFDPFEVPEVGVEHHYASYIKGLNLGARVRRSVAKQRNAIAEVIIKEMNKE